jgi:hypothetical protein
MKRFKIERNTNKDKKQLLQAKLEVGLVEEVNLLCEWSGSEKNFVIAQLLRYALSQEGDFQQYKRSLASVPSDRTEGCVPGTNTPAQESL